MRCQHEWEAVVDRALTGDGEWEYEFESRRCDQLAVIEVAVGNSDNLWTIQVCATHAIEEYGETEESVTAWMAGADA